MGEQQKLSALDRLIAQAIGSERVLGNPEDPARKKYPNVWEWLSRIYIGKDHIKSPAVLTIRLGPEGALATLTDRDLGSSVDASAPTLSELFAALEQQLANNSSAVRTWGKKEPTLRKRKSGN